MIIRFSWHDKDDKGWPPPPKWMVVDEKGFCS